MNSFLDQNELRTVVVRAYGHPIKQDKLAEVQEIFGFFGPVVPFEVFCIHDELIEKLKEYYDPRLRNK